MFVTAVNMLILQNESNKTFAWWTMLEEMLHVFMKGFVCCLWPGTLMFKGNEFLVFWNFKFKRIIVFSLENALQEVVTVFFTDE